MTELCLMKRCFWETPCEVCEEYKRETANIFSLVAARVTEKNVQFKNLYKEKMCSLINFITKIYNWFYNLPCRYTGNIYRC